MLAGKTFKMFFGIALAMILGLVVFLYYYNKAHVNVQNAETAYSLTAEQLVLAYQNDEQSTTEKYAESIIDVAGVVHEISTSNGSSVITLKPTNSDSGIICNMQANESLKVLNLQKGQQVHIKGVCSGYLLDVIMVRCILVE